MENLLRNTMLYDFYAELLTVKRKNIYRMYFLENLTMEEVGERLGITRQAVNFSLKQTQIKLDAFEEKLGMLALNDKMKGHIHKLEQALAKDDKKKAGAVIDKLKKLF